MKKISNGFSVSVFKPECTNQLLGCLFQCHCCYQSVLTNYLIICFSFSVCSENTLTNYLVICFSVTVFKPVCTNHLLGLQFQCHCCYQKVLTSNLVSCFSVCLSQNALTIHFIICFSVRAEEALHE